MAAAAIGYHSAGTASSMLSSSWGVHTMPVPTELFALNRRRLCEKLGVAAPNGVVLLQGGKALHLYDTDVTFVFQQESYFHWLFGVEEPDFYGALQVSTGRSYLFAPPDEENHAMSRSVLPSCHQRRQCYGVDVICSVDQMLEVLLHLKPEMLLILAGVNSDSGLETKETYFEGIHEFNVNKEILYPEITECRVLKTPLELDLLRYVNKISCEAHKLVMSKVRPGMYEYQADAIFQHYCHYTGGCRSLGYTSCCAYGPNGSVLRYGREGDPNNREFLDGDMVLFDMGAKYCGYVADISCSFPANGKFTALQAAVYNAVLRANRAVLAAVKPGVRWLDMHKLANKEMLSSMTNSGILTGNVDDMMKAHLGAVFQPHGLGHLVGKDVHDVGGFLPQDPPPPPLPGLRNLRTTRVLQAGMVLTVEPGCYFIDSLLDAALADPVQGQFLVQPVVRRLRNFGGVRIGDAIVVTETGHRLLTKLPRTIQEIEEYMYGKKINV